MCLLSACCSCRHPGRRSSCLVILQLLVAEVQSLLSDGTPSLHTRSLRYGKLRNGHLSLVPPSLVPRLKSHFVPFLAAGSSSAGQGEMELVMGLNGMVWVCMRSPSAAGAEGEDGEGAAGKEGLNDGEGVYSGKNDVRLLLSSPCIQSLNPSYFSHSRSPQALSPPFPCSARSSPSSHGTMFRCTPRY